MNEEVEGYFEFDANNSGLFQFGCVQGQIDYRSGVRDGKPSVELTWNGNDEMDAVEGRGWAVLEGDEIQGTVYFHQGDESEFKAEKKTRRA